MDRIGASDRQREREIQTRLQMRIERRHELVLRRLILDAMRKMADAFEADEPLEAVASEHREAVARALDTEWRQAAMTSGQRILEAAQQRHGRGAAVLKEMPESFMSAIKGWMLRFGGEKILRISRTTQSQVQAMVLRGQEEGLGQQDIADLIRDRALQFSRGRAGVIARTESHAAFQFGQQAAAENSGLEMRKEWIAAKDERTRIDHGAADGNLTDLHGSFIVGGERLAHPGDPAGSPENVINCRCATGFVAK